MAVADSLKYQPKAPAVLSSGVGGDVQVFETDETSEFTRALRARSAQSSRTAAAKKKLDNPDKVESSGETVVEDVEMTDAGDEKVDLHELSKDIKDDVLPTSSAHRLGRGVGSVLEMLKSDLTQKHAGKEILRGRAKDERTYEDYEPLNLGEVVRIDERTATKADRELAKREIKLEYRDKHGRLLTRKEAYRELCYKFHGHGSGKRKEEKKLQQIAREQAEARLVQESATMGALQATQKATGKAFVIHKAGK
jgi:U4/U6.U5 tri-snRNP-associated protein 1